MSTSREACPFCGKTFKRLNSHLPKCKMALVARTTPNVFKYHVQQDLVLNKKSKKSSSPKTSQYHVQQDLILDKKSKKSSPKTSQHHVKQDLILDKKSKKSSSHETSQKIKNTSALLHSPPFSTPLSNKTKAKKVSLLLPLSTSTLTTTKKSKTPSSPSLLPTSIKTTKKQKHLNETLIVFEECLPKDPDGILVKHIPTPKLKLSADSAIVIDTDAVKKLKAASIKAKLKAFPATTTLSVSPNAKAVSKKVSLRKQIELSVQTARATASLSQDTFTEAQREVKPSIQAHPTSTDDLTCNRLYNITSLLDHKPIATPDLNKDGLCTKTNKQETLSVDHISFMVDLVQTKTSDHLYNNKGLVLVIQGQTAAPALNHSSVTVGMLAPKTNSAHSSTMNPLKPSQTEVLESIVELSSTSAPFLISPAVHNQSRDTGPQGPNFPRYLSPIPSLSLFPSVSPLLCSSISPTLSPWIPTREVVGMEGMLEMTMPYQMIGLKQTFPPCAWLVLAGLISQASTRFTPFFTPSPPSPPPTHPPTFSGPILPFLSPSLPLCIEREKLATANENRTPERVTLKGRKCGTEPSILGALALGEVRLKELPGWIATRASRNPRQGTQAQHKSWQWYYKTYVDVKGGVGRFAMLVAGCCFFSYSWSGPQFTRERWRKYH